MDLIDDRWVLLLPREEYAGPYVPYPDICSQCTLINITVEWTQNIHLTFHGVANCLTYLDFIVTALYVESNVPCAGPRRGWGEDFEHGLL